MFPLRQLSLTRSCRNLSPIRIRSIADYNQILVDELLNAVQSAGQMDLMDAIAYPLPVLVICEMLGVPVVEEFLRYEGPVQLTGRGTSQDVEIGGKQIKAGEGIFTIIAAANRDPAQFPDPDRLDITRRENRHLAFGYGIHFCLGAALARLEAQSAISTMLRRMPRLALRTDTVQWRPALTLRGVQTLPVTF